MRYLPTIKKKSVLFKVVFMMSTANYVERKKKKKIALSICWYPEMFYESSSVPPHPPNSKAADSNLPNSDRRYDKYDKSLLTFI